MHRIISGPRGAILLLGILSSMLLTACDQPGPPQDPGVVDETAVQQITVASIPIFPNFALFAALEQGCFGDEGLEVELTSAENFAAGMAAVISGEAQFAFAAMMPILAARAEAAPLVLVAGGEVVTEEVTAGDSADSIVALDPSIQGVLDLEGRTVSTNALNNIIVLATMNAVEQAGGDPDSLTWLEMPFPEMLSAVESGTVDAAGLVEPFTTMVRGSDDLHIVDGAHWVDGYRGHVAGYYTTDVLADSEPETFEAFRKAIQCGGEFINDDPEGALGFAAEYINVDPAVASEVNLFEYQAELDSDELQEQIELMHRYGMIDAPFDAEDILAR